MIVCDRCGAQPHGVMEYRCAHLIGSGKKIQVTLCLACEISLTAWICGHGLTDEVEKAANAKA